MNAAEIPLVEPAESGRIAFARLLHNEEIRAKSVWDIYTINANGTDLRQLTNDAHAYEFWYSPDGTQLAYIRRIWDGFPNKVTHEYQLCAMNADGTAQRCLETAGNIITARWLPDGKRLVYSTYYDSSEKFAYVIDVDSSEQRPLTEDDIPSILSPLWMPEEYRYIEHRIPSPDGTKIAIRAADQHGSGIIDIVDVASGDSLQCEHANNEYNAMIPSWSPDSQQVAFLGSPLEDWWDRDVSEALLIMDVASGDVRRIADIDLGGKYRREVYPYAPVWSPDGSRIAFVGLYDPDHPNDDIYIIHPDGSDLRRVTTDGLPKANLVWIP